MNKWKLGSAGLLRSTKNSSWETVWFFIPINEQDRYLSPRTKIPQQLMFPWTTQISSTAFLRLHTSYFFRTRARVSAWNDLVLKINATNISLQLRYAFRDMFYAWCSLLSFFRRRFRLYISFISYPHWTITILHVTKEGLSLKVLKTYEVCARTPRIKPTDTKLPVIISPPFLFENVSIKLD